MVLGRAYQPPQRRQMDLARHHLETIWQEKTTRETSQAVERRPELDNSSARLERWYIVQSYRWCVVSNLNLQDFIQYVGKQFPHILKEVLKVKVRNDAPAIAFNYVFNILNANPQCSCFSATQLQVKCSAITSHMSIRQNLFPTPLYMFSYIDLSCVRGGP